MEEQGFNILTDLAKLSPLIALLVVVVIYLMWKLEKREKENISLHEYIRENDKENIEVLTNVTNTLDKVIEKQKDVESNVVREITNLKEYVKDHIKGGQNAR